MSQLRQSVNFFQEQFKKPEIKLPAKQMAQIAVIVLVGFVVAGSYQAWSQVALQEKLKFQEDQRDRLKSQFETLQDNFVEPTEDPALLKRLSDLKDDAEKKQKLREFLSLESNKSLFSFSSVLDGLATADVANIWLTQVKVSTAGNHYELKGITQQADAIPDYIEKLKNAKALQGTSFSVFNIERDDKREAILHFTLSSEQSGDEGEG